MSWPIWSNATGGAWTGKLGGMGSDPGEGDEWTHCKSCARPTRMTGTKLCDRCWETERLVGSPGNELYAAAGDLADALEAILASDGSRGVFDGSALHAAHGKATKALRRAGRLP